jgi:hypothetical protein
MQATSRGALVQIIEAPLSKPNAKRPNAGLQLRRAISTQAEGTKLLEKHAVAPSAARLCYIAPLD